MYDYHCSLLDGVLGSSDSITYGVTHKLPLNDLAFFHVCNNQLPQDMMHVLLEGVIPYELELLLHEFIAVQQYFELSTLNNRIVNFQYSICDSGDKPSKIKELSSHKYAIHQSGIFMYVLCMFVCINLCVHENYTCDCCLLYKLSAIFGSPPCIYICMYVCMYVCISCVCIDVCMYVCMYVCMHYNITRTKTFKKRK